MDLRIGHGYDIHRLKEGSGVVIGGVHIDCPRAFIAHSDGDAVMHAVTDSVFAAIGAEDLGTQFPNSDPQHEAQDSTEFLQAALTQARDGNWTICNVSITVICDYPKLSAHNHDIARSLESLIGSTVHIKGKSTEETRQVEAIEVHAVTLVQREST